MYKITEHPILPIPADNKAEFIFEGHKVTGQKGFTIAAALHQAGLVIHKHSLENRERTMECGIGKCGACEMIVDGQIRINERRLGEEREKVKKALADSIENGDEAFFFRITSALELINDEELIELREKLRQAFESKSQNPFELHSINVDLLTNGIAERNLILEFG